LLPVPKIPNHRFGTPSSKKADGMVFLSLVREPLPAVGCRG